MANIMDSMTQGAPFSTTQVGFHAKFTKRCSLSYPRSEAHRKTDIKHQYETLTKLLVGFALGGIVLAKYISSGGTNLPKFTFPGDRRDNFQFITKARFNKADNRPLNLSHFTMFTLDAQHQKMENRESEPRKVSQDGTLPKILLSDGFLPFNVKRIVVITDFDLINQAFKNPVISSKAGPIGATDSKTKLDFATERTQSGLRKYVSNIKLETGNTEKALNSNFGHIGTHLKFNEELSESERT